MVMSSVRLDRPGAWYCPGTRTTVSPEKQASSAPDRLSCCWIRVSEEKLFTWNPNHTTHHTTKHSIIPQIWMSASQPTMSAVII